MLLRAAIAIGIFMGGPALAFFVLMLGCEGASPALGVVCGHNILTSLIGFMLLAWLLLAVAATLLRIRMSKE